MLGKVTKIWLFLLPIAFMTSMAAMEFFSWSLFLIFCLHLYSDAQNGGWKSLIPQLKTSIDWALWGFFFVVATGAVLVVTRRPLDVVGDVRWILLLYAYSYMLKKYLTQKWESYLKVFCVVVSVVGLISLCQFLFGLDITRNRDILAAFGSFYRASGFFNHPLTFAYSIGMVGMVLLSLSLHHIKARGLKGVSYFLLAGAVLSGVGLITCLSRGAWLAGAVATLILFYQVNKKWALGAFLALVVSAGTLAATNSTIRDRFQSLTTVSQNESNRLRTVLWQANWEIFKDHPVIGVGLARNQDYLLEYYDQLGMTGESIVSHAHNNYLQMMAGTGSLGFLFYLSFCLFFLVLSLRLYHQLPEEQLLYRGLGLGIFCAQVFLHIGGLTQCNFTDGEVAHLLVFLWALLLAIESNNSPGKTGEMVESKGGV